MLVFKHLLGEVRRVGALPGDWSAGRCHFALSSLVSTGRYEDGDSPTALIRQAGMSKCGIPGWYQLV